MTLTLRMHCTRSKDCSASFCICLFVVLLPHHMGSCMQSSEALSLFSGGWMLLCEQLIMAEKWSPHNYAAHTIHNNNSEYLERLTRTGPKRLHVLYKYILSKFNVYNMNAHTHKHAHTQIRTRTHARTRTSTHNNNNGVSCAHQRPERSHETF